LLALFISVSSLAHEVRPAYLELRQTGLETYAALWKVPALEEDLRLGLYVELPVACTNITAVRASMINKAYTERWSFRCEGGLSGRQIHISGLSSISTDVLVRLERLDGTEQVTRLTPSAPSFVVEAAPRVLELARTYSILGVEHILTGIDHLLFILALLLITGGGWKLVKVSERLQMNFRMTPPCMWPLSVMTIGGSNGLRLSLHALIRQEPGLCLAGEAGTGAAALGLVFHLEPAVALVDVCLPDRNGFEVVKCIKQLVPTCAAIVLSDAPDPCVEDVARIVGATAVWHEGSGVNQLRRTLRRLIQGVLSKPTQN